MSGSEEVEEVYIIYLLGLLYLGIVTIKRIKQKGVVSVPCYRYECIADYSSDSCYGKIMIVNPDDIIIENDDKFFYQSVDRYFAVYQKIVEDSQVYIEYIEKGYSRDELLSLKLTDNESVIFGADAIRGSIVNGKIWLSNGRHRSVVAKKLRLFVIVYISDEQIISLAG